MHFTYYLSNLANTCLWDLNFYSSPFIMSKAMKRHSKSQWRRTPSFCPQGIAEQWSLSQNILLIAWQHRIIHLPLNNASHSVHTPESLGRIRGFGIGTHRTIPSLHGRYGRWTHISLPGHPALLPCGQSAHNRFPSTEAWLVLWLRQPSSPALPPPKKHHVGPSVASTLCSQQTPPMNYPFVPFSASYLRRSFCMWRGNYQDVLYSIFYNNERCNIF